MMKIFTSAAVACMLAIPAVCNAQWFVNGAAVGGESIELTRVGGGVYTYEAEELPNTGFYIHDEGETSSMAPRPLPVLFLRWARLIRCLMSVTTSTSQRTSRN